MGNHEFCTECGASDFHRGRSCDPAQKAQYRKEMMTEETKPVEREANPDEQRRRDEEWDRQVASLADYNAGYAAALARRRLRRETECQKRK